MITADHPNTQSAPAADGADEIFDLDRPPPVGPARSRAVAVGAAALVVAVAIALIAIVVRQDDAAASTPPTASFSLEESAPPSPVAAEPTPAAPSAAAPESVEVPVVETVARPEIVPTRAVVPAGSSRFVAAPPERVLDTRDSEGGGDAPAPDTEFVVSVSGAASVAFSVSIIDAARSGTVMFDGRSGSVEALRLPGPGATTTNLTVVPVDGDEVTIRSSAGGHLVVDVIGTFEAVDTAVAAGRFVLTERYRVGRLVTADEGRELELPLAGQAWVDEIAYDAEGTQTAGRDYDLSDASAVLVLITADVANEGGVIRIGPDHDQYGQMLMWGPASGDDRIRHGLAVLTPTDGRLAALRYDGGSELTVEVVGYFTGDTALDSAVGLLLPTDPKTLATTTIPAGSNRVVDGFAAGASGAIVTLNPTSGVPGRLGAAVVPTADGSGSIWTRDDVEVTITLLAEFG